MQKKKLTAIISLLLTANLTVQTLPLQAIAQGEETALTQTALPVPSEQAHTEPCGESASWTYDPETKTLYLQGEGEAEDFCWESQTFLNIAPEVETLIIENGITSVQDASIAECTNLKNLYIPKISPFVGEVEKISLNDWFAGQDMRKQLVSVTVSEATEIPKEFFKDMNLLESVTLPDMTETIGESAFSGCSALQAVPAPAGLKTISSYAFKGCTALTSLSFQEGLETIGQWAFIDCTAVTEINLPDSLKTLESYAFQGMSELKELVIPPNVENLGFSLIGPARSLESLTLPFALDPKDTRGENYATSLGDYILSHGETMPLKKVTITGGTTIPYGFMSGYSDVTEVNLPDSITLICKNAFYDCSGLTEIHLPENLEIIREGAFRGCTGITELNLPEHIKRIEYTAFFGMNQITELTIPDSAEYIGTALFGNDSQLQKITLPFAGESRDMTIKTGCNLVSTIGYSSSNREMPLTEITFTGGEFVPNGYFHYFEKLETINFADTMTELGDNLFYATGIYGFQNTALKSVTLPDNIISVGNDTFRNCPNLENITFSKNLREVGENAFTDTAWRDAQTKKGFINAGNVVIGFNGNYKDTLTIPAGTLGIGTKAFQGGTFNAVKFNDELLYIGREAFSKCGNLKEIDIPDSVQEIDDYAFYSCSSLETVNVPSTVSTIGTGVFDSSSWSDLQEDGPLYIGTKFYGYKGNMPAHTSLTLRDGIDTIADGALAGCKNLDEIILPESIETIGNSAFQDCISLKEVTIPDKANYIGDSAFKGCTGLKEIHLPAELKTLSAEAFRDCAKLHKIEIPYGTKTIGRSAFYDCGALKEVTIPDTLETVESYVFGFSKDFIQEEDFARTLNIAEGSKKVNYQMTKELSFCTNQVNLPEGLTTVCESAFEKYTLIDEVRLPSTVETVEKRAFYNLDNLKAIGNTATLSEVGEEAFYNTRIEETPAMSPDCVLSKSAFARCESLKKASLPENIQTIPRELFANCYELSEIVLPDTVTQIDYYAFGNNISLKTITIPNQLVDEFAMAGVFVAKDTINSAFIYDKNLLDGKTLERTIIFSEGRKGITSTIMNNFRDDVVAVVLPESLEEIESQAFENCKLLKSLTIPDNVSVIGTAFCKNCTALEEVTLPKNLEAVPNEAFYYTALKSITIPEKVTSIGASAFEGCEALKTADIADNVETIGKYAFKECSALQGITLPKNLKEIADGCFINCSGIRSISIPDGVTKIGSSAFKDAYDLKYIEAPGNITKCDGFGFSSIGSATADVPNRTLVIREGAQTVPSALISDLKDSLYAIKLPEGVTYLDDNAFSSCKKLQIISLPESLETIGKSAFANTNLKELTIPDGVTLLSNNMCQNCKNLSYVKFSEDVSIIPEYAFAGCEKLSKIDTVREKYSFNHKTSFQNCVSLYDGRFSVLNKSDVTFTANKTKVQPNGYVNLTLHYSFNKNVADENTSEVRIVLPNGVSVVEESLEKGDAYYSNNITLKNKGNSVTRTFTVKFADVSASYQISAVLSATIEGVAVQETIGTLDISALELSVNAPEIINSLGGVQVNGVATPNSLVTIYADGQEVGTATASPVNGRYQTEITLPSKEENTYTITAKSEDIETEAITITYNEGLPEIEKVRLGFWDRRGTTAYFTHRYVDITDGLKSGTLPSISVATHYPVQFDIMLDNPYNAQMVLVTSTRNGETLSMLANWIPEEGVYRAEGYFDPNNMGYLMGDIGIEIVKDSPVMYDSATDKFYGSDTAIDSFLDSLENNIKVQATIANDYILENPNAEDAYKEVYTSDELKISDFTYTDGEDSKEIKTIEFKPDYFYYGDQKVTFDKACENPEYYGFVRSPYLTYDEATNTMYEEYSRYSTAQEVELLYHEFASSIGLSEEEIEQYVYSSANAVGEVTFRLAIQGELPDNSASDSKMHLSMGTNPMETVLIMLGNSEEDIVKEIKQKTQQINNNNDMINDATNRLNNTKDKQNVWTSEGRQLQYDPDSGFVNIMLQKMNPTNQVKEEQKGWENFRANQERNKETFYEMQGLNNELDNYMNGNPGGLKLTYQTIRDSFWDLSDDFINSFWGVGTKDLGTLMHVLGWVDDTTFDYAGSIYDDVADWFSNRGAAAAKERVLSRLKDLKDENIDLQKEIFDLYKKLSPESKAKLAEGEGHFFVYTVPSYDPSGYVYEAVPENVIEGATMTVYAKDPETGEEFVWYADEFNQTNPMKTNQDGFYGWDVPDGIWRVGFEMDGYETVYTNWMTVPPIRTNVNISVVSKEVPKLSNAVYADKKIILSFSKYMDNQTMTPETIQVLSGKKAIPVKITPITGNEQFADTYEIEAESGAFPSGTLKISLTKNCKSYAGTAIQPTSTEAEIPETLLSIKVDADSLMPADTETEFTLQAFPASIASGKDVTFSDSAGIVKMTEKAVFDENGKAVIKLNASRTGNTILTFGADGEELTETFEIAVIEPEIYEIYEEKAPEEIAPIEAVPVETIPEETAPTEPETTTTTTTSTTKAETTTSTTKPETTTSTTKAETTTSTTKAETTTSTTKAETTTSTTKAETTTSTTKAETTTSTTKPETTTSTTKAETTTSTTKPETTTSTTKPETTTSTTKAETTTSTTKAETTTSTTKAETTTTTEETTTTTEETTTTTEETTTTTEETTTTTEETTTTTEETTTTTEETKPSTEIPEDEYFAPVKELCKMASKDYKKKYHTAPKSTETVLNEDGTLSISMKDINGIVLDTYTIDPKTGIGTDKAGKEVNLPQTGNHSSGAMATTASAVALTLLGAFTAMKSGIFRKKKEDE